MGTVKTYNLINGNRIETSKIYERDSLWTKEELDIDINPNQIYLIKENHVVNNHLLVDIFITILDVDISKVKIQEGEVDEICFVSLKELSHLDISSTCSYIKTGSSYV